MASVIEGPVITSLDMSGESPRVTFSADQTATYRIRYTSDFLTWQTVENPNLIFDVGQNDRVYGYAVSGKSIVVRLESKLVCLTEIASKIGDFRR